jgi:flavorubredoxin
VIQPPVHVVGDAYVVPMHWQSEGAPVGVSLNSMIVRGSQPALIDTGVAAYRDGWLDSVSEVVDLDDVRWIVLSHDDHDHTGNLTTAMERCPNATIVANWFLCERLSGSIELGPRRVRWLDHGDTLDAGDRTFVFERPPLYDSPTTRAIFDTRDRMLWAADCFATPLLQPAVHIDEVDPAFYADGFRQFQQWNSPWFELVDEARYGSAVDRFAALDPVAIVSCHAPVLDGDHVARAFALLRDVVTQPTTPMPNQAVLDAMLAAAAAAAAPAPATTASP